MATIFARDVEVGQFVMHDRATHYVTAVAYENTDLEDPRTTLRLLRVLTCQYQNLDVSSFHSFTIVLLSLTQYQVAGAVGPLYGVPPGRLPCLLCLTGTRDPLFLYRQYPNLQRFLVEHIPANILAGMHDMHLDITASQLECSIRAIFAVMNGIHYIVDYDLGAIFGDHVVSAFEEHLTSLGLTR